MILDLDIRERPAPAGPGAPDPRLAVAERWLCMLMALVEIGMRIAAFLTECAAPSPEAPGRPRMAFRFRGDPALAFVRIARAVRLAMAISIRIGDEIDNLKAARPLAPGSLFSREMQGKAERRAEMSEPARQRPGSGEPGLETSAQNMAEVRETRERAESFMSEVNTDVGEDRAFYRLLHGPLNEAVAAICADFGLKPDWSLWSTDGFPAPPGGGKEDWIAFFAPEGDTAPALRPKPGPPPSAPRARVCDPRHVLDPPRRDLNAFLLMHGIKPLPPPPGQRTACRIPLFVLNA